MFPAFLSAPSFRKLGLFDTGLLFFLLAYGLGIALAVGPFKEFGTSSGDLFSFWAAALSFQKGANPYNLADIQQTLDLSYPGRTFPLTAPVYSAPWIYSLIAPFALLPFEAFARFWTLLTLVIFVFCYFLASATLRNLSAAWLGRNAESSLNDTWRERLLLYFFLPFHQTLLLGQITPVVLLSLLLYLFLVSKKRTLSGSFLAGVCLSVSLVKPHLLSMLYLLILFESLRRKEFATMLGMTLGLSVLALLPLLQQASIYAFFFQREVDPFHWFTPSLGAWLYKLSGSQSPSLLFLPFVLCSILLYGFWNTEKESTGFLYSTSGFAIALSSLAAPYQWTYDFVLLFPCLLASFRLLSLGKRSVRAAFYYCLLPAAFLWLHVALGAFDERGRSMHFAVICPLIVMLLMYIALRVAKRVES